MSCRISLLNLLVVVLLLTTLITAATSFATKRKLLVAKVNLSGQNNVNGVLMLNEIKQTKVLVTGRIEGLPIPNQQLHISIHNNKAENGCESIGTHFNPLTQASDKHGMVSYSQVIQSNVSNVTNVDIEFPSVRLYPNSKADPFSIIGRSVAVRALNSTQDNANKFINSNAIGAPLTCGTVINPNYISTTITLKNQNGVKAVLMLKEINQFKVLVTGLIQGLPIPNQKFDISIYSIGAENGCESIGTPFHQYIKNSGKSRTVSYSRIIQSNSLGFANVNIEFAPASLNPDFISDPYSIIGKSIAIVHAINSTQDNGNKARTIGNAGAPLTCGTIIKPYLYYKGPQVILKQQNGISGFLKLEEIIQMKILVTGQIYSLPIIPNHKFDISIYENGAENGCESTGNNFNPFSQYMPFDDKCRISTPFFSRIIQSNFQIPVDVKIEFASVRLYPTTESDPFVIIGRSIVVFAINSKRDIKNNKLTNSSPIRAPLTCGTIINQDYVTTEVTLKEQQGVRGVLKLKEINQTKVLVTGRIEGLPIPNQNFSISIHLNGAEDGCQSIGTRFHSYNNNSGKSRTVSYSRIIQSNSLGFADVNIEFAPASLNPDFISDPYSIIGRSIAIVHAINSTQDNGYNATTIGNEGAPITCGTIIKPYRYYKGPQVILKQQNGIGGFLELEEINHMKVLVTGHIYGGTSVQKFQMIIYENGAENGCESTGNNFNPFSQHTQFSDKCKKPSYTRIIQSIASYVTNVNIEFPSISPDPNIEDDPFSIVGRSIVIRAINSTQDNANKPLNNNTKAGAPLACGTIRPRLARLRIISSTNNNQIGNLNFYYANIANHNVGIEVIGKINHLSPGDHELIIYRYVIMNCTANGAHIKQTSKTERQFYGTITADSRGTAIVNKIFEKEIDTKKFFWDGTFIEGILICTRTGKEKCFVCNKVEPS